MPRLSLVSSSATSTHQSIPRRETYCIVKLITIKKFQHPKFVLSTRAYLYSLGGSHSPILSPPAPPILSPSPAYRIRSGALLPGPHFPPATPCSPARRSPGPRRPRPLVLASAAPRRATRRTRPEADLAAPAPRLPIREELTGPTSPPPSHPSPPQWRRSRAARRSSRGLHDEPAPVILFPRGGGPAWRRRGTARDAFLRCASPPTQSRMNSKRRRSHSPVEYKEGRDKDYETSGRKDISRDLDDTCDARRGHESGRHSDKHSYGTSREPKRHDDYRRYHDKYGDDYGRSHSRASRSDRESRVDTYYDRSKHDSTSGRSRGDQRDVGRYGEKSVNRDQRSINEGKQESPRGYQKNDGGEYNKYTDAKKQEYRGYGDDRDHHRVVRKSKETIKEEEVLKRRNGKEIEKEAVVETREKKRSLFSSTGPNVDNPGDAKPSSATNEALDNSAGTVGGVNAAKVAAMKAAELVNRNIAAFGAGTGRLSTDQKKKLLWGNKKSDPSEETSKRWELFSDRERQEKFNKLMGVKSSAPVQESMVENKAGSSAEEAKKLEELDTNLEKHYIAGLRRRDGRTVGLGL